MCCENSGTQHNQVTQRPQHVHVQGGLDTKLEVQVTHCDQEHGVCVQMMNRWADELIISRWLFAREYALFGPNIFMGATPNLYMLRLEAMALER